MRVAVFTSTIGGNANAAARLAHLNSSLAESSATVRLFSLPAVTHGSARFRQYTHVRKLMMRAAAAEDIDVAVVTDDDTSVAPNFASSLISAVRAMPPGWRMLHLCPGWRWGREQRNQISVRAMRKLASWKWADWAAGLAPTIPPAEFQLDATGRFIANVAELVRRRLAPQLPSRVNHLGS